MGPPRKEPYEQCDKGARKRFAQAQHEIAGQKSQKECLKCNLRRSSRKSVVSGDLGASAILYEHYFAFYRSRFLQLGLCILRDEPPQESDEGKEWVHRRPPSPDPGHREVTPSDLRRLQGYLFWRCRAEISENS